MIRLMYLLDTNVISEPYRRKPRPEVVAWLAAHKEDALFLSVVTLGEIYFGAESCAKRDPVQARRYFDIGDEIWRRFAGAILPVRETVAQEWARLMTKDPSNKTDALLAATAVVHGLTVATRNEKHFAPLGVPFVNPFF